MPWIRQDIQQPHIPVDAAAVFRRASPFAGKTGKRPFPFAKLVGAFERYCVPPVVAEVVLVGGCVVRVVEVAGDRYFPAGEARPLLDEGFVVGNPDLLACSGLGIPDQELESFESASPGPDAEVANT